MWNKLVLTAAAFSVVFLAAPTADAAKPNVVPVYQMADNGSETVQEVATQNHVNSAFVPGFSEADAYNDVLVRDGTPQNREIFIVTDWWGDEDQSAALWWTKVDGVINERGICNETEWGAIGFCLIPNIPTGRTIFYQAATCKGADEDQLVCNSFGDYTMSSPTTTFPAS